SFSEMRRAAVTQWREEGGFEPTAPMRENGFRDRPIRPFSHPSGEILAGPPSAPDCGRRRERPFPCKERGQKGCTLRCTHAGGDRQLVVESRVATQVIEGSAGPRTRIGGPVDQASHPGGN